MRKIRLGIIAMAMLFCSVSLAEAQVSIGIGLPHVSIGINLPIFPQLVVVPGYPVYYAPQLDYNYFFYDGMYWVFYDDNWYASAWYNGPWSLVDPYVVPVYILRIPVRNYRHPPPYFHGWRHDAPPQWGNHWGTRWQERRRGWDRWNRSAVPAPAPLPTYQRQYMKERYPARVEEQRQLQRQHYGYQPRERVIRQHYRQQDIKRSAPSRQVSPAQPRPQQPRRGDEYMRRTAPVQPQPQQRGPSVYQGGPQSTIPQPQQHRPQPQQQGPQPQQQGPQEPMRDHGGHGETKGGEHGR